MTEPHAALAALLQQYPASDGDTHMDVFDSAAWADELAAWLAARGVKVAPSRSELRRIAHQKGEEQPTFEAGAVRVSGELPRAPSEAAIDAYIWSVTAGAPEVMVHERAVFAEGLRAAYAVDGVDRGAPQP